MTSCASAGVHRRARALGRHGAGEHGPGLRAARRCGTRRSRCGAEGRAVVVVGAPVPVAVPGVARAPRARRARCSRQRAARSASPRASREGREVAEDLVQEEAHPHALAAALAADAVHAVVPVAGAEQRQPVRADGERAVDARGSSGRRRRPDSPVLGQQEAPRPRPARAAGAVRKGARSSQHGASPVARR